MVARQVATSPVEPLLAVTSYSGITAWRLRLPYANGATKESYASKAIANSPVFSPDGLHLAVIETPSLAAFQTEKGTPVQHTVVLYNVQSHQVECRIQPGLLFSQIASQGNLHDMFCSCLDISPDGRCLALGRNDGRALTWALETPRAAYARLLLLRAATKEGAKPRVTATDAASTGHLVLFRLVDKGNADVAAYALKFIL